MNVIIKVIPHDRQRYATVGDWFFLKNGDLVIRVSSMKNWRYEMLVAVHELAEVLLCKHRRVSQKSVDRFDKMFELERKHGLHGDEEPGDDPDAPYKNEHCTATGIERILAAELGVCWRRYESKINSLP